MLIPIRKAARHIAKLLNPLPGIGFGSAAGLLSFTLDAIREVLMASLEAQIVYAVYANDEELALARIENGNDVNYCDEDYGCALTWAVQLGQLAVVRRLLEMGADPNPKNHHDFLAIGSTPLYLVTDYRNNCYRGELPVDTEIRALLIEAGGVCIPEKR